MSPLADFLDFAAAQGWMVVLVKSALLMLAVLVLHRLLQRTSAALRHLVLSVALAAALALPLASAVLPAWRLPILPAPPAPAVATVAATGSPWAGIAAPASAPAAPATPAQPEPPPATRRPGWPVLLSWVWLAGTALLLLRLGVGILRLRGLTRRARPLQGDGWPELAQRLGARVGLRQPVPLRLCDADVVPMVWGLVRPVVLLPASAAEWSAERREVVLLHELSHIRRRDPLAHLVGQLCHAVYWVNPLVWMAARRLRDERERACDDHVLAAGADPTEYAGHVLQIVRSFGRGPTASPALAMARRSQFEGRMLAILDPGLRRRAVSTSAAAGIALGVLLAVLPLAALVPVAAPYETAAAEEPPAPESIVWEGVGAEPALPDSLPLQVAAIGAQYRIAESLARDIVLAARAERLPVELAILLVRIESDFDEHRLSPRGAVGLTQILPATAATLQPGVTAAELRQRTTNLRLGFRHLRSLLLRYDGDTATALTAYHAGPAAVERLRAAAGEGTGTSRPAAPLPDGVPPAPEGALPPAEALPDALVGRMVQSVGSDGDRAGLLIEMLGQPLGDARLLEAIRATRLIGSDGDKRRVLSAAIARGGLGDAALGAVLDAAASIGSSGDRAAVLHAFLDRNGLPDVFIHSFFDAAQSIGSDGDKAGVLRRAVERGGGDAMLARAIDAAVRIGSDGDKSAVLVAVARRGPLGDALQRRYVGVAQTLGSDADRQRTLSALVSASPTASAPRTPIPPATPERSGWTTELNWDRDADGVKSRITIRARDVLVRRDGSCIDSVMQGGLFVLEESGTGATRRITVRPGNGRELQYEYSVDGARRPYDAAAQSWLSAHVQRLHHQMKGQTRI